MTEKLSRERIQEKLRGSQKWTLQGDAIIRKLEFKDFKDAMNFVNRVADSATRVDHHPDIWISYNKVKLELSTHSAGGLTEKDFELAKLIDSFG